MIFPKKICLFTLMFFTSLLFVGCQEQTSLRIIVPFGSPSYATLYLSDNDDYDITQVHGADPLIAAFGSKTYDVIIAPTNLGAKFYQNASSYQLVASIVWGNYYIISMNDLSLDALQNQTIYTFGKNQTPDIILQYVLDEHDVKVNYQYLTSTMEVSTQFILEPTNIYLIAEPLLSTLKSNYENLSVIDVQSLYQDLSGLNSYPQASVFAKPDMSAQSLQQLKTDIKQSIDTINDFASLETTKSLLETDLDNTLLYESITRSHLKYMETSEAKMDVVRYFEIIKQQNVMLLGESLPDDAFYR